MPDERGKTSERPQIVGQVARYFRQQAELGGGTLPLETLDAAEVRRLLGEARLRVDRPIKRPIRAEAPVDLPIEELPSDHEAVRAAALECTRCRLCADRTQVVFHDGTAHARLMVVGEAPGANEDRTGVPFVGAAGKFLDLLMASVGLTREESVYICNVLKCRPPGNRNPKPDEIRTCSPWLLRQIELVRPEVILAVGTFSAQLLSGRDMALGKLRGKVYSYEDIPLVVTYHPAALLRNSRWTRPTWEDFQLLRQVMEERAA